MKKYMNRKYTLIELLAAMAVFSVLLMISIRLFNGAQGLWLRSEQKTASFANARIAMEFVSSRMQSLVYYENVPFYIENDSDSDRIWFASRMPLGNSASDRVAGLRFYQFSLVSPTATSNREAGNLQLRVFSGRGERKFGWVFPAYNNDNRFFKNANSAFNYVNDALSDSNTEDDTVVDIIENVIAFNLVWHNGEYDPQNSADKSDWKLEKSADSSQKSPPYLVEVEIMMLDSKESFKKWQDASSSTDKDEIFAEYGYTFRRAVLLGKKEVAE